MKKIVYILMCFAAFLSGCQEVDHTPPGVNPPEEGMLKIHFTLPGNQTTTKGVPAEQGEGRINDLTLLFYDATTSGKGAYIGHHPVPVDAIPDPDEPYEDFFEFTLTIQLSDFPVPEECNILVIANIRDNLIEETDEDFQLFIDGISARSESEVIQYTLMQIEGVGSALKDQNNNSQAVRHSNLLMGGKTTRKKGDVLTECKLERVVSRFDVVNSAAGYRLVSASIWNAFPVGTVWPGAYVDYTLPRTERYYGIRDEVNGYTHIQGGLYAFENVSLDPHQLDDQTTCLIFGIQPESSSQGEDITYYRVNVHAGEMGQFLKRNHAYQMTITGVNGKGEESEPDAYKKGKLLLDISINPWELDEDDLILRDGDNLLAIPTRKVIFGPEAEQRQFYVFTAGEGTLELSYLDMPDGMKAWLEGNDLFVSVTSFTEENRKGSFELRFAGMRGVIEVIQTGQQEKMLRLEPTNLPVWPAAIKAGLPAESAVTVTSSGPWTAEIIGGLFSFNQLTEVTTRNGQSGDKINQVYTTSIHTGPKSRHSFILVTLDEDPENYRNILILTQAGTGGFTLTPEMSHVRFNADGGLSIMADNYNSFKVESGQPTDFWKVEILPSGIIWDNFEIEYPSGTTPDNEGKVTGDGQFIINTKGENSSGKAEAIVRVIHNEVNTKDIVVTQEEYILRLSHTMFTGLKASGETTDFVAVTSDKVNGTWSATIESNLDDPDLIPKLLKDNGEEVFGITNAGLNETFRVVMPGINKYVTKTPSATVTVKLDGTDRIANMTVIQKDMEYVPIHVQTYRNSYGAFWNVVPGYFNRWRDEMADVRNFGESGTVYSKGVRYGTVADNISDSRIVSINGVRIRVMNVNNPNGGDYMGRENWDSLKGDEHVVFLLSGHEARNYMFTYPDFQGYRYVKPASKSGSKTAFVINQDAQTINPALWDYLFVNGPFGTAAPGSVALGSDGTYGCLNDWPDTFVPLIKNPANQTEVVFGIDPANRLIWIGETDMFSNMHGSYTSDNANLRFLRNVLAWMVNINNYGDAFRKQFVTE